MMAYFKKLDARVRVQISTGDSVQFEAVSWNLAVYPHEGRGISDFLANELRICIARGVGGMTEISLEEYNSLQEKKKTDPDGMQRPWREEFKVKSPSQSSPTTSVQDRVAAHVEVNMAGIHRTTEAPAPAPGAIPQVPSIPRPTASKRK